MRNCERCGTEIGAWGPEGLCTGCLLREGLLPINDEVPEADGAEPGGRVIDPVPGPAGTRCFGGYDLLERIAQGGMGTVYKARQRDTGRIVALKILGLGPEAGAEAVQRFHSEVIAAASLQHPNIIALHEVGCWEGQHFFTMDFVDGPTLAVVALHKPLAAKEAARYVRTIAEAIHYAHERGVLHRDLKPSNVLVDGEDQPRVTDFSLAKRFLDTAGHSPGAGDLTLTGQVLGTPNYLPPEQAQGRWRAVGRASDVYGLGGVLYYLLTSRPPFSGESLETVLAQVLHQDVLSPRLLNGSVPRDLETICLKCLEKEPSRRYGTARMLADELGRFLRGEPIHARPVGPLEKSWRWARRKPVVAGLVAGMVLTLVLGAAGVLSQWQRAEEERRLQRRYAYASDMKAAQIALQENNLGMALNLLQRYLPQAGEEDLRGIEWRYLWQLSRSDELLSLPHPEVLRDAVLSPDARYLATCGVQPDCLVRIWDTSTARTVASFVSVPGIGPRKELAFSADGQWLAFAATNGVAVARTSDWQLHTNFASGDVPVYPPFDFSPDGRRLVMRGPGFLDFRNLPDGQRLVLTNAYGSLRNLSIDPLARWIAYSPAYPLFNRPGPILLWDPATGATNLLVEKSDPIALAFSPDGQWLAAGHWSGHVSVWCTTNWLLATNYRAHPGMTFGLAFSPDSCWLATGGSDQVIRFRETGAWQQSEARPALKGHTGLIVALSFSADGRKLASASSYDHTARLWNLAEPPPSLAAQKAISLPPNAVPVGAVRDGTAFVAFDEEHNAIHCLGLPDGGVLWSNRWLPPEGLRWSIRAFPENGLALGVATNGQVCSWELASGKPVAQAQIGADGFEPAYLSPDNHWLLGIRDDGTWVLCDLLARRIVSQFASGWFQSYAADFSPDGRWLAVSTSDYAIELWSLFEQRVVATLSGHTFIIGAMRFSPDSRMLSSGGWGSEIWRWSIPDGKPLGEPLRGHQMGVGQLAFSPDGKTLASSGPDRTVRWWDMATGQETLLFRDAILASGTEHRFRETYFAGQTEFVVADKWLVWREKQGPIRITPLPSLKEIDAIESSNGGTKHLE